MTTADTDALEDRIAEKMRESLTHKYGAGSDLEAPRATRDGMVSQMGGHIDVPHLAEEVMGVVAAEVRKAKAEALDRAEHRIARLEAQADIRGRAVVMYRERAREAEARIKAVEDALDAYAYTGIYTGQERVAVSDIRRALDN